MTFRSHNVRLRDGSETRPGQGLLSDDPACRSLVRVVTRLAPMRGPAPTVVDLGCLEGGYSLELARAGYSVLGIEARRGNYEKCELVRTSEGLPNLRFVCDDARNVAAHGEFDVVLCLGLLYHLDAPARFLELLSTVTRSVLVLNTHYAPEAPSTTFDLSERTTHEARSGRWYREYPEGASREEIEGYEWTSWGNSRSFWLTKPSLLGVLKDVGFSLVLEDYDFLGDVEARLGEAERWHRAVFVAIK